MVTEIELKAAKALVDRAKWHFEQVAHANPSHNTFVDSLAYYDRLTACRVSYEEAAEYLNQLVASQPTERVDDKT